MNKPRVITKELSNGKLLLPDGYKSYLDLKMTERAIKFIKDSFQNGLADRLNLERVSAPIAVLCKTGINDNLNGIEKPVGFHIKDLNKPAEIVQSLAKWKRMALADYKFKLGEGLYTDMNAIRPDEELDNLHSIYVDQWDWEKVISEEDRTVDFLKSAVKNIYEVVKTVEEKTCGKYNTLPGPFLPDEISFYHSEELEERFPDLEPGARETAICKEKKAVFVIGIGSALKNGKPHDGRAPDYDDWSTETGNGYKGLNGDILVYNPTLDSTFELSSMGIRVDRESLVKQLKIKDEIDRLELYFHQRLLQGDLPLSIGGGIGQSRLCMFYLRKAHIGEVQSGIWSEEMTKACAENNMFLL